jgi:hypothetical protein
MMGTIVMRESVFVSTLLASLRSHRSKTPRTHLSQGGGRCMSVHLSPARTPSLPPKLLYSLEGLLKYLYLSRLSTIASCTHFHHSCNHFHHLPYLPLLTTDTHTTHQLFHPSRPPILPFTHALTRKAHPLPPAAHLSTSLSSL